MAQNTEQNANNFERIQKHETLNHLRTFLHRLFNLLANKMRIKVRSESVPWQRCTRSFAEMQKTGCSIIKTVELFKEWFFSQGITESLGLPSVRTVQRRFKLCSGALGYAAAELQRFRYGGVGGPRLIFCTHTAVENTRLMEKSRSSGAGAESFAAGRNLCKRYIEVKKT